MSFTHHYTVRFEDTDAAGVVYFANILNICHQAYESSLEAVNINLKDFFTNPPIAYPIVHASVDFLRPIFCGDKLLVTLLPHKVGIDKFEIDYQILVSDVLVSKAITRHVCIDAISKRKREVSNEVIAWLDFCM
ncbi:MAG: acyl-CoA thioesterase [Mastigocoleus sp.]